MFDVIPTLFGAVLGFFAAIMPTVLQGWSETKRHQQEVETNKLQVEAAKQGIELVPDISEFELQAATDEVLSLNRMDADEVKCSPLLRIVRSSVRPLLTFGFFALFAYVKLTSLHQGMAESVSVMHLLPLVWDEDTQSLFAAIISFWFGSRSVSNAYAQRKRNVKVMDGLKGHNNGVPVVGD